MPHPEMSTPRSSRSISLNRIERTKYLNPSTPIWKTVVFWALFVWPIVLVSLRSFLPKTIVSEYTIIATIVAFFVEFWMLVYVVRRELRGLAEKSGVYTFACFGEFGQDRIHVECNQYEASRRMLAMSPDQILSAAFEDIVKSIDDAPEGVDLRTCEYVRVPSSEYGFDPSNSTCIRINFRTSADYHRTFYFFIVLSKSISEVCHLVHLNGRLTGRLDERLAKAREV